MKQEWVDEAVRIGKLSEDPAQTFSDLVLMPIHGIAVGPQIYKDISKRRKELLDILAVNIPPPAICPLIDFSITSKQWGILNVFAQRQWHNAVKLVITHEIKEKQAEFQKETKEFYITMEHDSPRLVIGAGGTVKQVMLPFEFRTVIAVCSKHFSVDHLKSELQKYGEVEQIAVVTPPKVTYACYTAAQRALTEFKHPHIKLLPKHCQQFVLKLQWERRQRGGYASLFFDSRKDCEDAYGYLCYTICKTSKIKVSYDKYNQSNLYLSGAELRTCDEDEFRAKINDCFSRNIVFRLKMGYKKFSGVQEVKSSIEMSTKDECSNNDGDGVDSESKKSVAEEYTEKIITNLLDKYSRPGTYFVNYGSPTEQAVVYKAYVTFFDPDEGRKVLDSDISREHIDGKLLTVTRNLTSSLVFQRDMFILIQDSLEISKRNLLQRFGKRLSIILQDKKHQGFVRIKISADDVSIFSAAQKLLHQASKPLVLYCKTTELQEYIVGYSHHDDFKTIQSSTSTYLCRDLSTMSIKIYGNKENQQAAMIMIETKANKLFSGGAIVTEVSLRDRERPGLMKNLVTKFGGDLSGMLELEGVRRIRLNPRLQLISLLATTEGQQMVKTCIEEVPKVSEASASIQNAEYDVDCPVCFTPVEKHTDLIRLECCGHAYHIECIAMQLKSNTLTFPIECAKDGCSRDFMWRDFTYLQQKLPQFRIPDLVTASLQNFMERNGDKYKNCPTPNCKMIYAVTVESREFICDYCSVSTCTRCNEQYHAGIYCTDINDDKLDEWMKEDPENRKKCPECSFLIEKVEGCMHMSCKCGAHICWRCLKSFKTSSDCYAHLLAEHGGFN